MRCLVRSVILGAFSVAMNKIKTKDIKKYPLKVRSYNILIFEKWGGSANVKVYLGRVDLSGSQIYSSIIKK